MSSWMGSWFHMQALRNDTRLYMNSLGSGINASGSISVDGLADSLQTQMVGGIQYTHGAASLAKDAMSTFTAEGFADINSQVKEMVKNNGGSGIKGGLGTAFIGATALGGIAGAIATAAIPGAGLLVTAGASVIGSNLGGNLAWKGWSWIRDNVLDQHGCYIQYLNKNGQAMDAGLNQSGQGMVVGRYHTKKLLPGILGVSTKVRTAEGYSYIRTDDLLKNLGWREKEINDLTRYISLENAIVNAQVLKYSGVGPEKAGLNRFFKVIARVSKVIDGDTIDVYDILDSEKREFRIRFDAINTPELNVIKSDTAASAKITVSIKSVEIKDGKMIIEVDGNPSEMLMTQDDVCVVHVPGLEISKTGKVEYVDNSKKTFVITTSLNTMAKTLTTGTATIYGYENESLGLINSPGGKSAFFTQKALKNKVIILRVSPDKKQMTATIGEDDFEAGAQKNKYNSYSKDVFGSRVLGTVFYKTNSFTLDALALEINSMFIQNKTASFAPLSLDSISQDVIKSGMGKVLSDKMYNEIFVKRFSKIFMEIRDSKMIEGDGDYFSKYTKNNSNFKDYSEAKKKIYNVYFNMRILQDIYARVSDWPNISWDEYYEDGTPASLNWELVVNNLAKVDTKGLLIEQPSVNTASEGLAMPTTNTLARYVS
jgi:hypothetical protein